ncbi:helix-turn-helix domain-containing protein [Ramlibacter humi]|uniref:Helix-turn-helix domain-containing protein n=1 Tax=Ramlibacter humi TaxID=2530451 RepID=A0A4Z0BLF4_9BURK|nr:helix-turn-helix domain-containing protein [Ramlibacter humi]TFZ00146.1 helix-turn-helix domain-containing protein [Ramlibacter humi]
MAAILELAGDMERAGLIDKKTLRSYEELCLAPPEYTAADVVRIRQKVNASQAFFARSLNVSTSALQQWESGAKRPSGSSAKLLSVVDKHGLEVLS